MEDDKQYSNSTETNRVLLQIYHERSNQLANMLIALNGFILAFISGLLVFVGSTYFSAPVCVINCTSGLPPCHVCDPFQQTMPVIIAINVAIVVLILWRFYAHYIDDDIVKSYQKIIRCEHILDVDKKLTLLNNFEKENGILDLKSYKERVDRKIYPDQKFEEKINIIENLAKRKKMGYRGHYWFNFITIFVISVLLVIEAILLKFITEDKIVLFIVGILGLLFIVAIFFYSDLRKYLTFLSNGNKIYLKRCSILIFFLVSLMWYPELILHI